MASFYYIDGEYFPVPQNGHRTVSGLEKPNEKSTSEEVDKNEPVE
jgi:hypothetical protein